MLCWLHIPHCWNSHVAAQLYCTVLIYYLVNSANTDEMPHTSNAAFCLGIQCLPRYAFRVSSIQRVAS